MSEAYEKLKENNFARIYPKSMNVEHACDQPDIPMSEFVNAEQISDFDRFDKNELENHRNMALFVIRRVHEI